MNSIAFTGGRNMEKTGRQIAVNVRNIRESKGYTQAFVAEKAGISRPAFRSIETGESVPRPKTLHAVAEALGVGVKELVAPTKELQSVRFRAAKKMKARGAILADVARWLSDYEQLEEIVGEKKSCNFESISSLKKNFENPEEFARIAANKARKLFKINPGEFIHDIYGLLEANGIKVFQRAVASDAFFGLSVGREEGGPAIVVNVWERIPVERWIFTAAHELGHLILHHEDYDIGSDEENDQHELEANIFASQFLMPHDEFISEWEKSEGLPLIKRVLKVKRIFGVSYKTVLYRLSESSNIGSKIWPLFYGQYKKDHGKSLSKADEPQALGSDTFNREISESLVSNEPERLSSADFTGGRLNDLVLKALRSRDLSISRGAEILRLSLTEMRELSRSWEVVRLGARATPRAAMRDFDVD